MNQDLLARNVVEKLQEAGFEAYFAGGWVRDMLLGLESSDIDIATSADPQQVMDLFPKTIPVGIEFGSVVVVEQESSIEVTTFRTEGPYLDGRRPIHIEKGSAQEDAMRRSFTINGMFYNPITDEIFDFVDGIADLKKEILRTIGDPLERFKEDRLRMIRALRFATRFSLTIDPATEKAIKDLASSLFPGVSIERIVQELEKMKGHEQFPLFVIKLHEFGLLNALFPSLAQCSSKTIRERVHSWSSFPKEAPLIAYLLELFPELDQEARITLCKTLRLSKESQKWTALLYDAPRLTTRTEWVRFYALDKASCILTILSAKMTPAKKETFLSHHIRQRQFLLPHIQRITGKPLVKAEDLAKRGVAPGPKMGQLLQQAEEIAIENNLHDRDEVLKRLS